MNYVRLRYAIVCAPGPLAVLLSAKPVGTAGMVIFGGGATVIGFMALIYKPPKPLLLFETLSLALALSVLLTRWPLRLAFRLSEPALERAAQRILDGERSNEAQWIGLFRVGRTEMGWHGVPCLWTGLNSNGKTGFALCRPDHLPFNIWEHQVMNERWQLILED